MYFWTNLILIFFTFFHSYFDFFFFLRTSSEFVHWMPGTSAGGCVWGSASDYRPWLLLFVSSVARGRCRLLAAARHAWRSVCSIRMAPPTGGSATYVSQSLLTSLTATLSSGDFLVERPRGPVYPPLQSIHWSFFSRSLKHSLSPSFDLRGMFWSHIISKIVKDKNYIGWFRNAESSNKQKVGLFSMIKLYTSLISSLYQAHAHIWCRWIK